LKPHVFLHRHYPDQVQRSGSRFKAEPLSAWCVQAPDHFYDSVTCFPIILSSVKMTVMLQPGGQVGRLLACLTSPDDGLPHALQSSAFSQLSGNSRWSHPDLPAQTFLRSSSRNTRRRTFPTGDVGNTSRNSMDLGRLYPASLSLQNSSSSASVAVVPGTS